MPSRQQAKTASVRARRVWRQVRRVGRWGLGAAFLTASVFTVWGNVNRIPFLSDLDIPPISEVFGGDSQSAEETTSTSTTPTSEEGTAVASVPGPLTALVDRIEVSTGSSDPSVLFDGDRATGWVPCDACEEPFGVGESITVVFSQPVTVTELAIVNGVDDVPGVLPLMELEMAAETGETFPLGLGDSVQLWRFKDARLEVTTSRLTFTITGVVRVDETVATTGIGEIELVGVPSGS